MPVYAGRQGDPTLRTAIYVTCEIPSLLPRPAAGTAAYRAPIVFRNGLGRLEDPDSARLYARLVQPSGTVLASRLYTTSAMGAALAASAHASFPAASGWLQQTTQVAAGVYEVYVQVANADSEQELSLEIGWLENGVASRDVRRFRVGDAADLDTVAADASAAAAAVGGASGIGAGTDAAVQPGLAGSVHAHVREAQVNIDAIETTIGTPAGASLAADVAAVKVDTAAARVASESVDGKAGAATDAATAPTGIAGSLYSKLRHIWESGVDLVLTRLGTPVELTSVVGMVGRGDDAVGSSGTAGQSLHSKLRKALDDAATALTRIGTPVNTGGTATLAALIGDMQNIPIYNRLYTINASVGAIQELTNLVNMIGKGDNAAGTTGTAAQSLHSKLRAIMTWLGSPTGASHAADVAAISTTLGAIVELASLVGMIGKGDDAVGSSGTAAQSLHSKLRKGLDDLTTALSRIGTPVSTTLADDANLAAQTIGDLGTLDGGTPHTTSLLYCSTLDSVDWYTGQRVVAIKIVGAVGRPRRTVRTVSAYNTGTKELTLSAVLPWTPVNGDMVVVIAP